MSFGGMGSAGEPGVPGVGGVEGGVGFTGREVGTSRDKVVWEEESTFLLNQEGDAGINDALDGVWDMLKTTGRDGDAVRRAGSTRS